MGVLFIHKIRIDDNLSRPSDSKYTHLFRNKLLNTLETRESILQQFNSLSRFSDIRALGLPVL